jgi:hypothetical protein
MKHLKTYEEMNFKQALIGAAIGTGIGGVVYTTAKNYDKANFSDTYVISGEKFKQYDLMAHGQSFNLNISEDGIISSEWQTSSGSGKNRTTITHNCITIPNIKMKEIWYETKFFKSGVFVSSKSFQGGKKLIISDLSIKEETDTYIVYNGKFFSPFDHIIINKNHTKGEEFTISDDKINKYVCDDIGHNLYLFAAGKLGGGNFGGSGSGSQY